MQLDDLEALEEKIDALYYTSFLLRFLEVCGDWMYQEGYSKTILWETRWYILEKQLEELGALHDLINTLPTDRTS